MIGDESNENNTQLAVFKDSVLYGETQAKDCQAEMYCKQAVNPKSEECLSRTGIMISYFSKEGKLPLVTRKKDLPLHQI